MQPRREGVRYASMLPYEDQGGFDGAALPTRCCTEHPHYCRRCLHARVAASLAPQGQSRAQAHTWTCTEIEAANYVDRRMAAARRQCQCKAEAQAVLQSGTGRAPRRSRRGTGMTELKEIAGDPGRARLGPQVTMLNATLRPVMTGPGSFIRAT